MKLAGGIKLTRIVFDGLIASTGRMPVEAFLLTVRDFWWKGFELKEVIYLGLAGALGAICRYGLSGVTQRLTGAGFPYGTLVVNIIGCLVIGFVMQIGLTTDIIPRTLRLTITVGFLGAFTTFSTFSYETVCFLQDGVWLEASLNIAANLIFCIGATLTGMTLGRLVTGGA